MTARMVIFPQFSSGIIVRKGNYGGYSFALLLKVLRLNDSCLN